MSIFPKRAIAGNTITIHWNVTLPAESRSARCPYVRIGIKTPDGNTHMLFEEHVLVLPSATAPTPDKNLKKHTPLLVLASYLTGPQHREKLVNLLTNIENGRHYYFTWPTPANAAPGKYTLLSEMYVDGSVKHSGTAMEDFFYIEQLHIERTAENEVAIYNAGPEPVPVKLITYPAGLHESTEAMEVLNIAPGERRLIHTAGKSVFLLYSEERITIPLHTWQQSICLRNQQLFFLQKEKEGEQHSYVLPREGETAWRLTAQQREIWLAADGMNAAADVRNINNAGYDEMIAQGLIKEIP